MPKIWLPQNVREALNPRPIDLFQKDNPIVQCDLIVNLTETSFDRIRMNSRHYAVCCVCGRRSTTVIYGTVENPIEPYFCGTSCFHKYKSEHNNQIPERFTRGHM